MAVAPNYLGLIPGPVNAEKITAVPGTDWIISSGMMSPTVPTGRIYAINARTRTAQEVFPYLGAFDHDPARFPVGPTTLDLAEFEPHGLTAHQSADGALSLYAINHGGRESVEVFDIDVTGAYPQLTWRGAVVLPRGTWPNDVAPLADGGFIASNTADPDTDGLAGGMARMFAGEAIDGAVEWHPGDAGASPVEGSRMAGANGIVATPDGSTVFIAGWRNKEVVRLVRSADGVEVSSVAVDILVDNLTWTPGGDILATGAYETTPDQIFTCFSSSDRCFFPCKVLRIDHETLAVTTVVEYGAETYGLGTTGLEVGDEVWVSSARAAGVARFAPLA